MNNNSKQITEIGVKERNFKVIYKNYGQLPAQNVSIRSKAVINKVPTTEDLKDVSYNESALLMPGESAPQSISLPADLFQAGQDGKVTLYLIFRLDYQYEGKGGYYQVVVQLRGSNFPIISSIAG